MSFPVKREGLREAAWERLPACGHNIKYSDFSLGAPSLYEVFVRKNGSVKAERKYLAFGQCYWSGKTKKSTY
ncbi:MAG: hypothetical protein ACJAUE_000348 [Alcanivorax sp.]